MQVYQLRKSPEYLNGNLEITDWSDTNYEPPHPSPGRLAALARREG